MSQLDRNGNTQSFSYNALGSLLEKKITTPENVETDIETYAYSKIGNRVSMANDDETTSSIYDDLGRIITETTGNVVKNYTYDAASNLKTYKLTRASTIEINLSYEYDYKNRLTTVKDSGTIVASYTYDNNNNLVTTTANGQITSYAYNLANMLTELDNKRQSTSVSKYNYEYYTSGNQYKEISMLDGTTTYVYDGLGRLKSETTPNEALSYQYNDNNNRKKLTATGSNAYVVDYSYDANNRLTNEVKTIGQSAEIKDYFYDNNGNLTRTLSSGTAPTSSATAVLSLDAGTSDGLSTYSYDGWNRQTKAVIDSVISTYAYNADGLRISKTVDGELTGFILEGGYVVAETNATSIVNKYVYGNGLIYQTTGSTKTFYNFNGHGDVTQLVNTSGVVTKNYNYDAFGVEVGIDANDTNPFHYCAEYFDGESGSIYLRARYYAPSIGRFTTEDPIKDGLNWYVYCGNDPVNHIDPTGTVYIPVRGVFETFGKLGSFNKKTKQIKATIGKQSWVLGKDDDYWSFIAASGTMHMWVTSDQENGLNLPSLSGNSSVDVMIYTAVSQKGIDSGNKYLAYTGMSGNWCTSFVVWAAGQAGLSVPNYAGNASLMEYYKDNSSFYLQGGDYVPKAGDFFFMGEYQGVAGAGHTGVIIAYDSKNGYLYTAEGNSTGGKVNIIKRPETGVYGYGSNGGTETGIIPKKVDYTR